MKIPQAEDAKYLGLYLDHRLNWRKHITKRKQLGIQLSKLAARQQIATIDPK